MKILTGKVISKRMGKTATVAVERIVVHPLYKKRLKRTKKYHVHDELGVTVGQIVKFVASRPFSKLKRWRMVGEGNLGRKPARKVTRKAAIKADTRKI